MLVWVSNAASFACCIAYGIVGAAFLKLRKKEPNLKRPYKIKHYKLVGILAVFLSFIMVTMYVLPGTGSTFKIQEWTIILLWFLIGVLLYIFNSFKAKRGNNYEKL